MSLITHDGKIVVVPGMKALVPPKPQNYWQAVANIVRSGLGRQFFPVSSEFVTHKENTNTDIIWRVVAHDHHTAASSQYQHTMTLEMKFVYGTSTAYKGVMFDATEALYYAENGLEAGSYYFTVKNQAWYTEDNDVPYYFTLTEPVPAGGQLVLNMTYNQSLQNKTIKVYSSPSSNTEIETATLTATPIDGAVNLGEPDGNTDNMNFMHRAIFGSNNYAQSAVRQLLNSNGTVGTFWQPQTKFDRAPSWHTGSDAAYAGFVNGLSNDFLNAVKEAVIPCRTNSVYEVNSLDGTEFSVNQTYHLEDKFFILSRPEIYGTWDSASYKDGELLDYYDGTTHQEKIKYDEFGSAIREWLRSPYPSYGGQERTVNTSGTIGYDGARGAYGVSVACIIA